jgi:hypothetical protein
MVVHCTEHTFRGSFLYSLNVSFALSLGHQEYAALSPFSGASAVNYNILFNEEVFVHSDTGTP